MGYNSPHLTCAGPGGSGVCRSQSPVTHIREWPKDKHGANLFTYECANCARKQFPERGHEKLPEARKMAPDELARHQKNQLEGWKYEQRGMEDEWD